MNTNKRAELREKVERLVGTAILKNDKNYTDDFMDVIDAYTDALVAEAEQEGRKRLAALAKEHEKPAGYFKRDTPVMMVSTLEWAATLPLGEEAK